MWVFILENMKIKNKKIVKNKKITNKNCFDKVVMINSFCIKIILSILN